MNNKIPENCVMCEFYTRCDKACYLSLGCNYYDSFIANLKKDKETKENEDA